MEIKPIAEGKLEITHIGDEGQVRTGRNIEEAAVRRGIIQVFGVAEANIEVGAIEARQGPVIVQVDAGCDDEIRFFIVLGEVDVVVVAKIDPSRDIHQDRAHFKIIARIERLILIQFAGAAPARHRGANGLLRLQTYLEKKGKKENKKISQCHLTRDVLFSKWEY